MTRDDCDSSKAKSYSCAGGIAALCAALALGIAAGGAASATPTLTVLHSFAGPPSDGAEPFAGAIVGSGGNLYGTTGVGVGPSGCGAPGCGTVFKLSPGGTNYKVLHSFAGPPSDGAEPFAGVIVGSGGNVYGTTGFGGGSLGCLGIPFPTSGCGTVFKLAPGGTSYKVLHAFSGSDGALPFAGLIADSSGNLFGTTQLGGAPPPGVGFGVVFKLSPGGALTLLHSFAGPPSDDGFNPEAGLIADSHGNLYGVTVEGGGTGCGFPPGQPGAGCGVVFKPSRPATPGGVWTETVLHSFAGGASDGAFPVQGLIADGSGNLYGTTGAGGGSTSCPVFTPLDSSPDAAWCSSSRRTGPTTKCCTPSARRPTAATGLPPAAVSSSTAAAIFLARQGAAAGRDAADPDAAPYSSSRRTGPTTRWCTASASRPAAPTGILPAAASSPTAAAIFMARQVAAARWTTAWCSSWRAQGL